MMVALQYRIVTMSQLRGCAATAPGACMICFYALLVPPVYSVLSYVHQTRQAAGLHWQVNIPPSEQWQQHAIVAPAAQLRQLSTVLCMIQPIAAFGDACTHYSPPPVSPPPPGQHCYYTQAVNIQHMYASSFSNQPTHLSAPPPPDQHC